MAWAGQAGFAGMCFLSGEDIAWNRPYDDKFLSGLKTRYNGTARHMGFRKDHNGFYAFDFNK